MSRLLRVEFTAEGRPNLTRVTASASPVAGGDGSFGLCIPFVKLEEAKRVTKGPALRPEIRDRQGSIVSADEIEGAAHSFLERLHKGDAEGPATGPGLMHEAFEDIGIRIVESWITDTDLQYSPENRLVRASAEWAGLLKAGAPSIEIPAGSWMIGMHYESDEVWKGIVNGTFKGYSIGGWAVRVYEDGTA